MTGTRPRVVVPVALTIAGSDSSGGAGIQADLKTFTALGVYGASVITALTAQNTRGVTGIMSVPAFFVASQIRAIASDLDVTAVKTGMLGNRNVVEAVAAALGEYHLGSLVIDPVMAATSGDSLMEPEALDVLRGMLLPRADLITPNIPEAARLLDVAPATTVEDMERQARALLGLGPHAVLVKGGHATGDRAVDILAIAGAVHVLDLPRVPIAGTHGTGCTLSAAITALLATNTPLLEAVRRAKEFVWHAIASASQRPVGRGAIPVDHTYAIRQGSNKA